MKILQGVSDKVVVEILKDNDITDGGIIIPDTVKKSPHSTGRVLSIGNKVEEIQVGDIVLFAQFGGQATFLGPKEIRVLCFGEIYGVLKDIE